MKKMFDLAGKVAIVIGRHGQLDVLVNNAPITVLPCSAASDFVTGTAIAVDGGYAING